MSVEGILLLVVAASVTACGTTSPGPRDVATNDTEPRPRIVQPGSPGQASRTLNRNELDTGVGATYTAPDAHFMRGMIPHHAQALEMTALVRDRSISAAVRQMALRMEISQRDEIALMERWLVERGEPVRMNGDEIGDGGGALNGTLPMMPGMLSPDQMQTLVDATGDHFDRLFLEYMIQHHRGAITMVEKLFRTPGAGQGSLIFRFASDVDADQRMEITRMQRLLDAGR